jgi:hypothetical protein
LFSNLTLRRLPFTVLPLNCRSGSILQRPSIAGQHLHVVSARSVRLFSVDTSSDNGAPYDVASDEDVVSTGDAETTEMYFKDLQGLDPRILSAIDKLGLSETTEIQAKSYGPAVQLQTARMSWVERRQAHARHLRS